MWKPESMLQICECYNDDTKPGQPWSLYFEFADQLTHHIGHNRMILVTTHWTGNWGNYGYAGMVCMVKRLFSKMSRDYSNKGNHYFY